MRIGLLGDTHDRLPAITELLQLMQKANVELVMHVGDYCAPFALNPMLELQVALLGVFGRNDGDREGLKAHAAKGFGIELYESPHSFEVGGHRILMVHDIADIATRSIEQHAFVFHGHSHKPEMQERGDSVLINPGEACGWLYGSPTAAIVDLDTRQMELLKLSGPEWAR